MKDRFSNRLRSILVAGLFSCLVNGEVRAADKVVLVAGGSGNEGGPATEAKLVGPFGVDFDRSGNAFLVEIAGHRVLKIDRHGVLTRMAGTGIKGDRWESTIQEFEKKDKANVFALHIREIVPL